MPKCEDKCGHAITVKVYVPTCLDARSFTWNRSEIVGEAADEVAEAFGIKAEDPTFQTKCDSILDRSQTLQDAGVKEGDKLEFVSPGGGV